MSWIHLETLCPINEGSVNLILDLNVAIPIILLFDFEHFVGSVNLILDLNVAAVQMVLLFDY